MLDLLPGDLGRKEGRLQELLQLGGGAHGQLHLALGHVHVVVVDAVQGGCSRGGDPGCAGTGHEFRDLAIQHVLHAVWLGPHAFADLRAALQIGVQADVHIASFIRLDPILFLHVALADHRPCTHACVDLVAGAVQKARVDEKHTFHGRAQALAQVGAGAALLVHDAHLDGVSTEAEELLRSPKEAAGQGNLLWPMLLRLHNVDGTFPAVQQAPGAAQVVEGASCRDHAVEKAFWDELAIRRQHRIRKHVMPNVSHKRHGPARDGSDIALCISEPHVVVHSPRHGLAALHKRGLESTPEDAQDVAIHFGLVLRIHGRH
mmetsp:Transcript_33669/g.77723  ORF Transcript_33669/g.77723 Transcript_33669/m.77723 type:complete len:318 (-) Transcript_33669:1023-1976(-)